MKDINTELTTHVEDIIYNDFRWDDPQQLKDQGAIHPRDHHKKFGQTSCRTIRITERIINYETQQSELVQREVYMTPAYTTKRGWYYWYRRKV